MNIANELRLGNLVYGSKYLDNDSQLNIITVELLSKYRINIFLHEKVFGIELTEDWVLKLGFEKKDSLLAQTDDVYFTKNDLIIGFSNAEYYPAFIYDEYRLDSIGENIKYVHQLQNLYYALTGEELTIKDANDQNTTQTS